MAVRVLRDLTALAGLSEPEGRCKALSGPLSGLCGFESVMIVRCWTSTAAGSRSLCYRLSTGAMCMGEGYFP